MKSKDGNRPKYSESFSIRMLKAERETWITYSDKLGLSGNRFFAKAISDYIDMINEAPENPIKTPFFLAYCRSVIHGGNGHLQEQSQPFLKSSLINEEFRLKVGEKLVEIVNEGN